MLSNLNLQYLFSLALWCAAIGHFCILGASFQIPYRLGWKQDLAKLTPFNRKLMWTYGAFVVLTVIAFGALTFLLHDEMLRGDRAAMGLASFIGIYWSARIAVDAFYFDHKEWPQGLFFVIGHWLLMSLFVCLAATYLGLVMWHIIGGHV